LYHATSSLCEFLIRDAGSVSKVVFRTFWTMLHKALTPGCTHDKLLRLVVAMEEPLVHDVLHGARVLMFAVVGLARRLGAALLCHAGLDRWPVAGFGFIIPHQAMLTCHLIAYTRKKATHDIHGRFVVSKKQVTVVDVLLSTWDVVLAVVGWILSQFYLTEFSAIANFTSTLTSTMIIARISASPSAFILYTSSIGTFHLCAWSGPWFWNAYDLSFTSVCTVVIT